MNYTLIDVGGFLLAAAAGLVVLVAPGAALARLFGLESGKEPSDTLAWVIVGLAALPALYSVVARFSGLDTALGVGVLLAVATAAWPRRGARITWPSLPGMALVAAWLLIVCFETIDFDIGGKLYQPLSIFDMVKHAATTQAIYDSGAPPRDAFFLRPERASYYYFFYTLGALMMRLTGGLVSAKAAFAGTVFWTGIGVYGLVRFVTKKAGLKLRLDRRRQPLLVIAVLAAGGLDILAIFLVAVVSHYWIADPLRWNEQVGAWFEDVVWVPHHVTALIAGVLGLAALCDAMGEKGTPRSARRHELRSIILAGICFASSLGLSVWVTFGFVITILVWMGILAVEKRWRSLALVLASGVAALILAFPQLLDLKAGRSGDEQFPVVAMVRPFMLVEQLVPERFQAPLNAISLPLSYAVEFGALALGAFVFWRQRRRDGLAGNEFHRTLTIAAISGLVAGGFLRSIIFANNDLGWRVTLLPLLAGTVWTLVVVDRLLTAPVQPVLRRSLFALFAVGWATVAYTGILMRAYPFVTVNPKARFIAADPATEHALRTAFDWARANLPQAAVLQQNPTFRRAFAFGMYGNHPVAVADAFASLYGADPKAVAARLDIVGPIFKERLSLSDVATRSAASGIDDLVVTAGDPVWSDADSFVWRVQPVFAAPRVRIIPVRLLEAAR